MNPERLCPNCRNPVPLLSAECLYCHRPLGPAQPAEEPRFQVVRAGQPVVDSVPEEVRSLDEQSRVYYCKLGGQTVGPVTAADIREAFAKGQIDGQASVGIKGRKEWFPIRALPQFSHLITGVGPKPAPRAPAAPPSLPTPPASAARSTGAPPSPASAARSAGAPPSPTGPRGDAARALADRPTALPRPGGDGRRSAATPLPALSGPSSISRNDETLVVSPLPSPALLAIGGSTGQLTDPQLAAWQREVRSWRRLAIIFGVLSGALVLLCAALVGVLASS